MSIDWSENAARLEKYWSALPGRVRLLSEWSPSRRFPELTYIREELLGSYKARKYLSLLPWLKAQGYRRVRVAGSSHSGNVTQLGLGLRQQGLEPLYVMEGRGGPPAGNLLLNRLIYGETFGAEKAGNADFVIPEGGSCVPALAGSLGLAGSLVENALARKQWEETIYVDSGTGFSAAALLMGLAYFSLPCRVKVVSMTGQTEGDVLELIEGLSEEFLRLMGERPKSLEFEVLAPPAGPSFGSVPVASLAEVQSFAQEESILVDPIYTAKLSLAYRQRRSPSERALMFVSGGVRELLCFQGPLRKYFEKEQGASGNSR